MDAYNFENFPNVSKTRLEELKTAFVNFDKDLSGDIFQLKFKNLKQNGNFFLQSRIHQKFLP